MEAQAIAYTTNHASVVFKLLIECLEARSPSWSVPESVTRDHWARYGRRSALASS